MVRNRTTGRTECPACRLANASRDEIYLAHELALFLPMSTEPARISVPDRSRPWTVDIHIPERRLVVEYDGAYWHAGREHKDREKTESLTADGWAVVRLREAPLEPVTAHSVPVRAGRHKETANAALLYLRDALNVDLPGLDAYVAESDLRNAHEARRHMARLLEGQLANAAKRAARRGAREPEAVA